MSDRLDDRVQSERRPAPPKEETSDRLDDRVQSERRRAAVAAQGPADVWTTDPKEEM